MTTRVGTHHYRSLAELKNAYPCDYKEALKEGRVVVGRPRLKEHQRLLVDDCGRYWIEDTRVTA